jgi:hypothetical protein
LEVGAASVPSLWRSSPNYLAVLLNPDADRIGVGVAGSRLGSYWTATFGEAGPPVAVPLPATAWLWLGGTALVVANLGCRRVRAP